MGKARILYIEDNIDNMTLVKRVLEIEGFEVIPAETGKDGVSKAIENLPDIIITDINLPDIDGYEVTDMLKSDKKTAHIPVIAITADALKGTEERCLAAGMDCYVTKPMQLDALAQVLNSWMPNSNSVETARVDVAEEPERGEAVDATVLPKLLGTGDPKTVAGFYASFLSSSEETVVEIGTAFASQNTMEIGQLAHKLKSSAKTVGALALSDCCLALEQAGKSGDMNGIGDRMEEFQSLYRSASDWIKTYMREHGGG